MLDFATAIVVAPSSKKGDSEKKSNLPLSPLRSITIKRAIKKRSE